MGELGAIRRYSYWSGRRVESIAADNGIGLERRSWRLGFKVPALGFLPQAEVTEERRSLRHHEMAIKLERAIGQLAVEDFSTPPPARFAKGSGPVTLAAYSRWYPRKKSERKGVVAHTTTVGSDGKRIEVCLFGSVEHCADYLSDRTIETPMWSSSSTWAIQDFIANRGTKTAPMYDEDESIAIEIVRVFNNEGMTGKYAFKRDHKSEWFAEVYHDVELDKHRWNQQRLSSDWPHPIDRIVIGAPLWIRSV
jgi:hypothetical protein